VLGVAISFVIWIAGRSTDPTVIPATTDDKPETVPRSPKDRRSKSAAAFVATENTVMAPPPMAAAPVDASAEELAAWREQQAEWRKQNAEWKAQQAASERELRQQRAAETRDRALAHAAAAAEMRRLHQLANPRISAAAGWGAIGAAIVAGGIASLVAIGNPELTGFEATIGLAVASLALGATIVIAGALRKRSGILSFLALVSLIATLLTALVPVDRGLVGADTEIGMGEDAAYSQLAGRLSLSVHEESPTGVTEIWQGAGSIRVEVFEGAAARVEMVQRAGDAMLFDYVEIGEGVTEYRGQPVTSGFRASGDWHKRVLVGNEQADVAVIRIWQGAGQIEVIDHNESTKEEVTP
jgi:hypothetical protein